MAKVALEFGIVEEQLFLRLSDDEAGLALSVSLDGRRSIQLARQFLADASKLPRPADASPDAVPLLSIANPSIRVDRDDSSRTLLTIFDTGLPPILVKLPPQGAAALAGELS